MFQALSGIVDLLVTVVSTIQSFFSTLLGFFELIPRGASLVVGTLHLLPPVLAGFAAASIALCVLLFILGR